MARLTPLARRPRVSRPRWPALAGLALLAGCRVAPLGGPAELWPTGPLDLTASQLSVGPGAAKPAADQAPEGPRGQPLQERLRIPPELPGSEAPLPQMPTGPERL